MLPLSNTLFTICETWIRSTDFNLNTVYIILREKYFFTYTCINLVILWEVIKRYFNDLIFDTLSLGYFILIYSFHEISIFYILFFSDPRPSSQQNYHRRKLPLVARKVDRNEIGHNYLLKETFILEIPKNSSTKKENHKFRYRRVIFTGYTSSERIYTFKCVDTNQIFEIRKDEFRSSTGLSTHNVGNVGTATGTSIYLLNTDLQTIPILCQNIKLKNIDTPEKHSAVAQFLKVMFMVEAQIQVNFRDYELNFLADGKSGEDIELTLVDKVRKGADININKVICQLLVERIDRKFSKEKLQESYRIPIFVNNQSGPNDFGPNFANPDYPPQKSLFDLANRPDFKNRTNNNPNTMIIRCCFSSTETKINKTNTEAAIDYLHILTPEQINSFDKLLKDMSDFYGPGPPGFCEQEFGYGMDLKSQFSHLSPSNNILLIFPNLNCSNLPINSPIAAYDKKSKSWYRAKLLKILNLTSGSNNNNIHNGPIWPKKRN